MDTLLPGNIFTATGEGQAQTLNTPPTCTMQYRVTRLTPTLVIPARNSE